MKKIYYAHCMAIYGTPQEQRDIELMTIAFPDFDIWNPNTETAQLMGKEQGMEYFEGVVRSCDLLVFRGLPNGKIPAGVWKEIETAKEANIPVVELPCFTGRQMTVDETRMFLREIGQR